MANNQAYVLLSTGNVVEGFDQDQVVKSFADLFNCAEDKALTFATSKKIIRKDIDKATGESYTQKLKDIGLDVQLIPRTPPAQEALAANSDLSPAQVLAPAEATHSPPRSTATVDRDPRTRENPAKKIVEQDVERDNASPFFKAIMGPLLGAAIGAVLWAMILNGLGYEFALVAIVVGAIVGFGAMLTGFNGSTAGVICALLVAVSIFSGKYIGYSWVMDAYNDYDNFVDEEVIAEAKEWGEVYKSEAAMLQDMTHTDDNLGQFMMENDYGYTESPTQEDLGGFKLYTIPMIMAYENYSPANPKPTYQKLHELWKADSGGSSVIEAVKSGLGATDLLFLIFGMAGAFRMVSKSDD